MDIGLLFVFAISSLGVYGVVLGGWASNNKYSFLGGLRSSAQLVSYEIPLGLSVIGVLLFSGSLRMETIIARQAETGWWWFAVQPLAFIVFMISGCAESARLPFDLPECEQELVAGYHTEYTAMKFGMFAMAEYQHMITVAFLAVLLFFGGWHLWGLAPYTSGNEVTWIGAIIRVAVLSVKVLLMVFFFMWIRWAGRGSVKISSWIWHGRRDPDGRAGRCVPFARVPESQHADALRFRLGDVAGCVI